MPIVGFHASHEQLPPSRLLAAVQAAEAAGFTAAMCSDHLAPWSERQGHSGYAWSWLGAAMQATSMPFGVVTAPGQRYHPAITAQAIATLGELFPGRSWAALGSGEALNEHVTGDPWPPKPERDARLLECVEVIRALLRGEEVTHDGRVRVDRARVWSLPESIPALFGAAVGEETARTVGGWADGLITVRQPVDVLRRVIDAFREGGGERQAGRRPGAPLLGEVRGHGDGDRARSVAHERDRPGSRVGPRAPRAVRRGGSHRAPRGRRRDAVLVSADPAQHVKWLREIADLGVDAIYLHHVGKEQDRFIDVFAEHVLPEVIE